MEGAETRRHQVAARVGRHLRLGPMATATSSYVWAGGGAKGEWCSLFSLYLAIHLLLSSRTPPTLCCDGHARAEGRRHRGRVRGSLGQRSSPPAASPAALTPPWLLPLARSLLLHTAVAGAAAGAAAAAALPWARVGHGLSGWGLMAGRRPWVGATIPRRLPPSGSAGAGAVRRSALPPALCFAGGSLGSVRNPNARLPAPPPPPPNLRQRGVGGSDAAKPPLRAPSRQLTADKRPQQRPPRYYTRRLSPLHPPFPLPPTKSIKPITR